VAKISVFEYLDYRQFLRDFYQNKKEENAFFSYRYMANRVDIDPGYLVKLLQGKYHLAVQKTQSMIDFCGFDAVEAEYFENLILFCRAKSESQTKLYFEKLLSLRSVQV
jgi:uncharacterized protein (TIGR02147 family)